VLSDEYALLFHQRNFWHEEHGDFFLRVLLLGDPFDEQADMRVFPLPVSSTAMTFLSCALEKISFWYSRGMRTSPGWGMYTRVMMMIGR